MWVQGCFCEDGEPSGVRGGRRGSPRAARYPRRPRRGRCFLLLKVVRENRPAGSPPRRGRSWRRAFSLQRLLSKPRRSLCPRAGDAPAASWAPGATLDRSRRLRRPRAPPGLLSAAGSVRLCGREPGGAAPETTWAGAWKAAARSQTSLLYIPCPRLARFCRVPFLSCSAPRSGRWLRLLPAPGGDREGAPRHCGPRPRPPPAPGTGLCQPLTRCLRPPIAGPFPLGILRIATHPLA